MTLVRRINARRGRGLGDVSKALLSAFEALAGDAAPLVDGEVPGHTLRQVCESAQVGLTAGDVAMRRLVGSGRVLVVGTVCVPGRNRPAQRYALANHAAGATASSGAAVLWSCIHSAWLPVGGQEQQEEEKAT